jgi:hypothetical protein
MKIVEIEWTSLSSPVSGNVTPILIQCTDEHVKDGEVYTVWRADGKGWYGMPQLSSQFKEIQGFGDIGVFQYQKEA